MIEAGEKAVGKEEKKTKLALIISLG